MKKLFYSLLCILLVCTLLCGCSLFGKKDAAEESTANQATNAVEDGPSVKENWGPAFEAEGTMQQVSYEFISSVFSDTWKEQFECGMKTEMIKWGIGEGSEDDMIRVYVTFAAYADEPSSADQAKLTEGNSQAGKDDYEGAYIVTRYCYLQKQSETEWQCIGFDLSW